MKKLVLKYRLEAAGVVTGAIAGWCYWYFVGCASGTCLITSRPLNSSLYGALMGAVLFSMFKKDKKQTLKTEKNENDSTNTAVRQGNHN